MKKNQKHKWKYAINLRKKVLVLVMLGVSLFVGLGYSILGTNLQMFGTLQVSKRDRTLYNVLKKEAANGYGAKYDGNHQDSMDSTKSTEDIYHFYSNNEATETAILNKNNVVFANSCWQLIRTTDTGGVRMIYNGDPEEIEVNGETKLNCGTTRNLYHMGGIKTTLSLSGTYKYAKNYTVTTSGNTTTFTLVDDPNDPDDYKSITVDSTDTAETIADIVENYPYTCRNSSGTCTNTEFYKVLSQNDGRVANVYMTTSRDNIGTSKFNANGGTISSAGYMYGDQYVMDHDTTSDDIGFANSKTVLWSTSFQDTYLYSKTLNLTGTSSVYELDNPIAGSSIPEDSYVGYYTYRSSTITSGSSPYYIVGRDGTGSYYYFVDLSSTKQLSDYNLMIGTDLVDNGNNTYTIKNGGNGATLVTPVDWYNDYSTYVGKYTCGDTTDTCANPRYIYSTNINNYSYVSGKITISTERTGTTLSGSVKTIRADEWYNGYNTTYNDYYYTCGNTDTVCTETNLKYIYYRRNTYFKYLYNRYYGKSIKYEDGVYKLQDYLGIEAGADVDALSTHHYFCAEIGKKECAPVASIGRYSYVGDWMYHLNLNDPEVTDVKTALDNMLKKNTNDSIVKQNVDAWYEANLKDTDYESKLEDTIYCNNRSFRTDSGHSFQDSMFNDNGGSGYLYFKDGVRTSDLTCENDTDKFSTANNDAKLKYNIGLLTLPEIILEGAYEYSQPADSYHLMTPLDYDTSGDTIIYYFYKGWSTGVNYSGVSRVNGVRPAISLAKGTSYSSGTGHMTDPYIVDMSN